MATRRIISGEKTILEKDDKDFAQPEGGKSNIAPAVPAHVIYKLLGFTLAMVVGPIGSYFLTLNLLFRGNSTYAGAFAAIMANVVLIGYVVVAFQEDQTDQMEAKEKEKREGKKVI
ncbi:related to Vacuolar ATPase assembly integral membrane protein VMA21 [Phialocephala subalpina]|uniref:Related to Vacuolar ATPase assembly integral membrane protein VMA21 n=1 Tax=Phialocephala subalpina TaxID=576137 RepID=A0A1L7WDM3_9HELO|nr:related to Vacuolar ATPase assembly integral membrane protein VMA21 [Phialocephala subalpina]